MAHTTKLPDAMEMRRRFARIVGPHEMRHEREFYSILVICAGSRISAPDLVLAIRIALRFRHTLPVHLTKHLEAMVGNRQNEVFQQANRMLKGWAVTRHPR